MAYFENREAGNIAKQTYIFGTEDGRESDKELFIVTGNLYCDDQLCEEEITRLGSLGMVKSENTELVEPQKENPYAIPAASIFILKNYLKRFEKPQGKEISLPGFRAPVYNMTSGRKLSTDEVVRLAARNFIQSCSDGVEDLSVLMQSIEDNKDIELVQDLLASAEKVGHKQFHRAKMLLHYCNEFASSEGNSVQRLVYYFSKALREKIDRETDRSKSKGSLGKQWLEKFEEAVMSPSSTNIAYHQKIPFYQVNQYSGMQVIFESVAESKKIHIIDLAIMKGAHIVILMQALAARSEFPVEHLRITAIRTKSKQKMKETGERLTSFAHSLSLNFSFDVILVEDMLDLKEDSFKLEAEETAAVHSSYLLSTMIFQPDRLDCLMRVIKSINPSVMVVTEVEANLNSTNFFNRFIEALFFYGCVFDSIEDCMGFGNPERTKSEVVYLSGAIENIVAAEGDERSVRQVKISVWRKFFGGFGMIEQELSMSSLYQASLVLKNFECGSSCTLAMDDKSLLVGWKGTPLQSLSAWKFML